MNSRVILVSCYELGHEPLGLSVPAGVLGRAGIRPRLVDLAIEPLDEETFATADFVGISTPMHTALRLGVAVARRVREIRPGAHICFFGPYAELNSETLAAEADSCLGAEFEVPLVRLVQEVLAGGDPAPVTALRRSPNRDASLLPDRTGIAHPDRYVKLSWRGDLVQVGYTAATRGCRHLCRHCPLPPVYGGTFYAVPADTVLEDVAALVERGARHITFADPDFLNGPTHALRIGRDLHRRFPDLTFDYTAKVEHLLRHGNVVRELKDCGNLFVVSAIESFNVTVLDKLAKGHTRSDALEVIRFFGAIGLALRPTFVPFTPWETLESYADLLDIVASEGLVEHIDPVQYSIRLLIPPGSLLLDDEGTSPFLGALDQERFTWTWEHPDPSMDSLQRDVAAVSAAAAESVASSYDVFADIRRVAFERAGRTIPQLRHPVVHARGHAGADGPPRLTEAWFC